jgi:hypothetical protein
MITLTTLGLFLVNGNVVLFIVGQGRRQAAGGKRESRAGGRNSSELSGSWRISFGSTMVAEITESRPNSFLSRGLPVIDGPVCCSQM